jgi:hypothetical protein
VIDPNRAGPSEQTAPANTSAAAQRVCLLGPSTSLANTTTANIANRQPGSVDLLDEPMARKRRNLE